MCSSCWRELGDHIVDDVEDGAAVAGVEPAGVVSAGDARQPGDLRGLG